MFVSWVWSFIVHPILCPSIRGNLTGPPERIPVLLQIYFEFPSGRWRIVLLPTCLECLNHLSELRFTRPHAPKTCRLEGFTPRTERIADEPWQTIRFFHSSYCRVSIVSTPCTSAYRFSESMISGLDCLILPSPSSLKVYSLIKYRLFQPNASPSPAPRQ